MLQYPIKYNRIIVFYFMRKPGIINNVSYCIVNDSMFKDWNIYNIISSMYMSHVFYHYFPSLEYQNRDLKNTHQNLLYLLSDWIHLSTFAINFNFFYAQYYLISKYFIKFIFT